MDIHDQNKIYELNAVYEKNEIVLSADETDVWVSKGRPCQWVLVETDDVYSVYEDVAYGRMALFINDSLVSHGMHMCSTQDIVVLHKEYFGVSKYIWK